MKSSKLSLLLQKLSEEERGEYLFFLDWQLPESKMAKVLARQICDSISTGGELPNKFTLFKSLLPEENVTAKQINYTLSKLNKLAEQFLAWKQLSANSDLLSLAKLRQFSRLELDKHFKAENKRLQASLFSSTIKGAEDFLSQTNYFNVRDERYIRKKVRREDANIEQATNALDAYYYTKKLQLACSMLDRQKIIQADVDHQITPGWLEQLAGSSAIREPIVQLYLTIFHSLQDEDNEAHFWKLKEALLGIQSSAKPEVLGEITQFSINYCARKIRLGQQEYVREALDLYREGIEQQWLFSGGELSPWAFTNVVKLFLRLQEYQSAKTFIEEYEKFLPGEFRENARNYNMAELLYYTDQKTEAQQYLLQVAYSDLNYYLGARVLLAKIYFETEEEEALLAHLAAFIIFLKRNKKISKDIQATFLNFCQILHQIMRRNRRKTKDLLKLIEETKLLTDRDWLKNTALEKYL